MKHSPISLLERAAELYDFGAALRAPVPVAVETEPLPAPQASPGPVEAPREAPPRRALRGAAAAVDRAKLHEAGHIVPEAPATGLAEEFRLIKRQLLAGIERRVSQPEEKRRSVLIASPQTGDGKSFCAVNLALSLAGERDVEVLLVDSDFVEPGLLPMLGIEEDGPGLVDALADPAADPEAFVVRTDVVGLSVLPAGARRNNVPELLASDRTREVLVRLVAGNQRRIILLDSPPALMASPAAVLSAHVGQALVVVRADRTTEADLRETVGLLSGCDHIALILNGAGFAVTGRRFGSYEGHGDGD